MHRFRLYFPVLLLWILCASASLCSAGGVAKVDPADYQHYRDLLYTLYDLEDPAFSDWSVGKTREMFGVLQELQAMKAKGFVLDKADALLKIQNRLVENMHAHCLVLAVADNPGTVLLRVGKTPNNAEFGGLLSAKVSDFDMTMAGKSANRARDTHLNLLKELYGDDFAKMTMTDISTADATIAAWKLDDVRKAYATAALNPEMHRTYSGLSFVEDYIVQVGEISYLDKETGKLVTRKLADPEFNGDVTKFRNWANGVFEQAGEEMRFGMRKGGFCLGLTTDISNQLWMNLEKDENQAAPQNVIKKYVERYAKEVQARTQIDLRTGETGDSYNKIQQLIAACDAKEPGALDRLKKQTLQFEERLRETVYQKQSSLYEQMIAAGNHDVADAVLLDTEGAYQNLESANRKLPTATAASLTEEVAKDIAREPVFVEPGVWRGWMNKVVCDDATLAKYLGGSTKVAIRIGPAIYAIYDAKQREEAGDSHALRYAVTRETVSLTFDGVPAALKWLGCKAEVAEFGALGMCWGMMDMAAAGYDMWVDHLAQTMFVDPTVLPRLAGVTEEGKQINDTDIITALGEPITPDDLGAPARYPTGVYEMGEVVAEHDTNGDILRKHLSPSYKISDDYQRIADYNHKRLIWETEAQRRDDPPLQFPDHAWSTTRLTRGEMIAQNRLSRVYETLRRKFVKTYPGAGEKIAQLDARQLREPFHLAEPLEFDSPVGRDEIMFYWNQYNQAAIKCAAALQRETSVWRSVGFDAEKKLSDLSARKFLEAMARCAAHNERAKEFYLNADALTLEAQLKLRIKAHFDGRDITPEEIQKRIDSLRAAEVASASGKTDVWKQWVKDHWDISMPADGDGPEPDFRIVSTMAVPAGADAYRVVCRYRLKNQMSFDFHLVDKSSNTNFTSEEDNQDPECDKDLYAPGLRTLVFHVARAESDADATFLIKFTQPNSDQVIAASSDVVVPAMHRRYVFQGLSQIVGKPKYQTKSDYNDTVWTLVSGIDGRGVHMAAHRQSDSDHTWTHSEIWIGPMPAELKNGADFGAWMEALRTQHGLEEVVDGQRQQTTNLDGNLFSAAISESDDNGKFDDQLHLTDLGGEASPKELDEAARLGLPPLHPAQGEGAEHAANLFSSKIDFVFTPPAEKRFRATVQVNGGPQLQFEWVYRLDSVQYPTPPSNTPTAQTSQ